MSSWGHMVRVRRAAKKGGGGRKEKGGAKKRGVHAAQAHPLYTLLYAWTKLQGKTIDTWHTMTETGHQILVDESVIFYFCIKEKYELMPVSFSFVLFSSRVIEILVDERISNNKGLWEVPNSVKWQKKGTKMAFAANLKMTKCKFLNLTI